MKIYCSILLGITLEQQRANSHISLEKLFGLNLPFTVNFFFISIEPATTFVFQITQMFFLQAVTNNKRASSGSNTTSYSAFSAFFFRCIFVSRKVNRLQENSNFNEDSMLFLFKSTSRLEIFHNATDTGEWRHLLRLIFSSIIVTPPGQGQSKKVQSFQKLK